MLENPFEVTKAVDFSDEEIAKTWVNLPGGGFEILAPPTSPMPHFLIGGKGGGRTHLLRYYSFPLQCLRHRDSLFEGVLEEGYLGIYLRCSSLNALRFDGKGYDDDTWTAVFAYYLDIWLGRLVLDGFINLLAGLHCPLDRTLANRFVDEVKSLFTQIPATNGGDLGILEELAASLRELQRSVDSSINNAALTRTLELEITANPGSLVFGIPRIACSIFSELSKLRVAYLIDEFENLTGSQQKYVNTLIREKQLPSTFLIGSRLWGIRTHATLGGGEENKLGSEFEQTVLEDIYRKQNHDYTTFCTDIVRRRLDGFDRVSAKDPHEVFETAPETSIEERAREVLSKEGIELTPWMARLESKLVSVGVPEKEVRAITDSLAVPGDPIGEKFALLAYYRLWAKGENLNDAVMKAVGFASDRRNPDTKGYESYKHYRKDLFAQFLKDLGIPQEYCGFGCFIDMSGYLPRNLLIVLKRVTRWALFVGDRPFHGGNVSLRAQYQGVKEASEWFLSDATGLGQIGADSQRAVRRLGDFLAAHRFSDKPVEVECSQFEVNTQTLTPSALMCLKEAATHSLLLASSSGRKDRNTGAHHQKFQINPMLGPLFSLPLVRRGCLSLSPPEANAIFDRYTSDREFALVRDRRLSDLNAPFGQVSGQGKLHL